MAWANLREELEDEFAGLSCLDLTRNEGGLVVRRKCSPDRAAERAEYMRRRRKDPNFVLIERARFATPEYRARSVARTLASRDPEKHKQAMRAYRAGKSPEDRARILATDAARKRAKREALRQQRGDQSCS